METRTVKLEWLGEGLQFSGGGTDPDTPAIVLDGAGGTGPSPMQALLLSAAGCTAADVVVILEKMRAGLRQLTVIVTGRRRDAHPKRYESVALQFRMSGAALDRSQAERAVKLSLEKYCSVLHTFDPAIEVSYDIELA